MRDRLLAIGMFGLLGAIGPRVAAQGPGGQDTQWQRIAAALARLQPGRQISVHTTRFGRLEAQLVGSSETTVSLRVGGSATDVQLAEIDSLWLQGNHAGTGAIVGAATFGVLGALAGYAIAGTAESPQRTGPTVGGLAVGAAGGALLGAFIGLMIPKWVRFGP
jgi:hypothetical protein